MSTLILDMMDRRPIWAMPLWVPEELRAALPDDWELVVVTEETDGSGDGAGRVSPVVLEHASVAAAYLGYGVPEALLHDAPDLRWIHSGAAGVGSSLTPALLAHPAVFTNSAGIHAPPMAESVLGMILYFGRGLGLAAENQRAGRWDTDPYYEAGAPLAELSTATVGIVGYGGIGREVARRVASLGADVLALKRREPVPGDAALAPVGGTGSLEGKVTVLNGSDGLDRILHESDILVLAAPETDETRGMMDTEAFARMKTGALFINVARGKLVDEDALAEALESGQLRGAGLDVFAREPLPAGHPLWSAPNTLITPHVSGVTRGFWRRECDLILHNLAALLAAAPMDRWRNVVDRKAGY